MFVESQSTEAISNSDESVEFAISQSAQGHLMRILRTQIYSDKILAVLREYGANGWDSHRMSGIPDRPIEVKLPFYNDYNLRIRDFGDGMSHDQVMHSYSKYGDSTKRSTNDAVGSLGLGCKSAFAYATSFAIRSFHGGKVRSYAASLQPDNSTKINFMGESDSTETGVEIVIPVSPDDIYAFREKARHLFFHFEPTPYFVGPMVPEFNTDKWISLGNNDFLIPDSEWYIVMGCIPYRIPRSFIQEYGTKSGLPLFTKPRWGGILHCNIGDITVVVSREEVELSEQTITFLHSLMDGVAESVLRHDEDKTWAWQMAKLDLFGDSHSFVIVLPPESKLCFKYSTTPDRVNVSTIYLSFLENNQKFRAPSDGWPKRSVIVDFKPEYCGLGLDIRKTFEQEMAALGFQGLTITGSVAGVYGVRPAVSNRGVDSRKLAKCAVFKYIGVVDTESKLHSNGWTPVNEVETINSFYIPFESFAHGVKTNDGTLVADIRSFLTSLGVQDEVSIYAVRKREVLKFREQFPEMTGWFAFFKREIAPAVRAFSPTSYELFALCLALRVMGVNNFDNSSIVSVYLNLDGTYRNAKSRYYKFLASLYKTYKEKYHKDGANSGLIDLMINCGFVLPQSNLWVNKANETMAMYDGLIKKLSHDGKIVSRCIRNVDDDLVCLYEAYCEATGRKEW